MNEAMFVRQLEPSALEGKSCEFLSVRSLEIYRKIENAVVVEMLTRASPAALMPFS